MAASDRARPVCETQADALLAPLTSFRSLALGVSGGPDSTALLLLVAAWRARRTAPPDIHVLTVDHGLRPEAAHEARAVAQLCDRLGLACRVLTSRAPKPFANRQAAARDLRRTLLVEASAELGAEALVLAHHLDDQAETLLLRLARGSGVYGLAAMPARGLWHDGEGTCVEVLRPLLAVSKASLVATCRAAGEAFAEDPSNDDPAYARTRLRRLMPALAREGLDATTLAATAGRLASAAAAIDAQVDAALAAGALRHPAGPVRLRLEAIATLPRESLLRLFARLLAATGGEPYPPRLARLEGLVERLAGHAEIQSTLSGVVARRRGGEIVFWREPGRGGLAPVTLRGPGRAVFDRRFLLEVERGETVRVVPLGTLSEHGIDRKAAGDWPAPAFAAAPLLLGPGDAAYCPGLAGTPPERIRLVPFGPEESLRRAELAANPFAVEDF
ncbi:tRNA lysidine(34) synthetase TilS [Stappia sp. TSB10GB4]|uniref:tRNA lysidine(34) synthetase TilS n=1 Tax=Stappia sp. TSB10GB4 TaxID=2003584 RepID=UPI001647070E|nr:tRNA lysidine(34) synthetase TilS [Stappia sp. TSB10GB4]